MHKIWRTIHKHITLSAKLDHNYSLHSLHLLTTVVLKWFPELTDLTILSYTKFEDKGENWIAQSNDI